MRGAPWNQNLSESSESTCSHVVTLLSQADDQVVGFYRLVLDNSTNGNHEGVSLTFPTSNGNVVDTNVTSLRALNFDLWGHVMYFGEMAREDGLRRVLQY